MPEIPTGAKLQALIDNRRVFELQRGGGFGGETEWLINGLPFEQAMNVTQPRKGSAEIWELKNGGGGWVHPMHLHQEEHRVVSRNGVPAPDGRHPDDTGKFDVVDLDPGESVLVYRRFGTFTGAYVAHCHQLAHEDHAMRFGWSIAP